MLDAAIEVVEGIVGPIGDPTPVTETHYEVSSPVLVLRRTPTDTLTAVSTRYGATTTALLLADYELETATGIVRRVDGGRFYGTYTVTYMAGLDVLPAAIYL